MTDTELFEIVKGHREAWPEVFETLARPSGGMFFVRNDEPPIGRVYVDDDEPVADDVMMLFEAAFHRALLKLGYVFTENSVTGEYCVQACDFDFTGGSLIEAYANALRGLK